MKRSALLIGALLLAGCRQDMHDAPRLEPLEKSDFWGDERGSRPLVEGTVARGQLHDDDEMYTGKVGTAFTTNFPMPVTKQVVERGQSRFQIYCTPCHGALGKGDGMVVRRGYRQPPSFHDARLQQQPAGYFYDVITNGFGAMPDYRAQIPEASDRWAIVAYVRALQLSQNATLADVPEGERGKLAAPTASEVGHKPESGTLPPSTQGNPLSQMKHEGGGAHGSRGDEQPHQQQEPQQQEQH